MILAYMNNAFSLLSWPELPVPTTLLGSTLLYARQYVIRSCLFSSRFGSIRKTSRSTTLQMLKASCKIPDE
jgi:hypothetical protein